MSIALQKGILIAALLIIGIIMWERAETPLGSTLMAIPFTMVVGVIRDEEW